jgi:hypothetical protein
VQFWDSSENWTTEFGPAFRDTIEKLENLVPCMGDYVVCFHSGPEPVPCELTKDEGFAHCKCTVIKQDLNFVLISAILNYRVYLETVNGCGLDGSRCADPDTAPVCSATRNRKLVPGADLISTFSGDVQASITAVLNNEPGVGVPLTVCPKGPYVACVTAPCKTTNTISR